MFSQFSSTLKRIQQVLPSVGLQFRTLTGDMSLAAYVPCYVPEFPSV